MPTLLAMFFLCAPTLWALVFERGVDADARFAGDKLPFRS